MTGVLVVDKPAKLTSADVVARVRRALAEKRVGHTGTLDPMATGVLPIVVGEATKIASFLLADDKGYDGEALFGLETDTLDIEGAELGRDDEELVATRVTAAAVAAALAGLTGAIQQVPPQISAIRKDGERAYARARRGEVVDLAPRPVRIDVFEALALEGPRLRFRVACSKGTYVRSLVRDLGRAMGVRATLTALRRTRAGEFHLADAVPLAEVQERGAAALLSPVQALRGVPRLTLDAPQVVRVRMGQRLAAPEGLPEGPLCLLDPAGALVAMAEIEAGRVSPRRVLHAEPSC